MLKGNERVGVHHSTSKYRKNGAAPRTHPAKKAAVVAGFAQEKSIRQIARETKLNPRTVTKIVDEILPEWDEWKSKAIERTKKFVDKALDSYEYALDEETDGRVVHPAETGLLN